MKRIHSFIAAWTLVALVGCSSSSNSGGETPILATGLSYTDPTPAANEWALLQDASSTSTHLVLNLQGPSDGSKYRGIGFTLQADTALVKFARFTDESTKRLGYYRDGGVFRDRFVGQEDPKPVNIPPQMQVGGVYQGKLMVGIFQKGDDELLPLITQPRIVGPTAKDCSGTVLQVGIDFDPSLKAPVGSVPLKILEARTLGAHLAGQVDPVQEVILKVGALELK